MARFSIPTTTVEALNRYFIIPEGVTWNTGGPGGYSATQGPGTNNTRRFVWVENNTGSDLEVLRLDTRAVAQGDPMATVPYRVQFEMIFTNSGGGGDINFIQTVTDNTYNVVSRTISDFSTRYSDTNNAWRVENTSIFMLSLSVSIASGTSLSISNASIIELLDYMTYPSHILVDQSINLTPTGTKIGEIQYWIEGTPYNQGMFPVIIDGSARVHGSGAASFSRDANTNGLPWITVSNNRDILLHRNPAGQANFPNNEAHVFSYRMYPDNETEVPGHVYIYANERDQWTSEEFSPTEFTYNEHTPFGARVTINNIPGFNTRLLYRGFRQFPRNQLHMNLLRLRSPSGYSVQTPSNPPVSTALDYEKVRSFKTVVGIANNTDLNAATTRWKWQEITFNLNNIIDTAAAPLAPELTGLSSSSMEIDWARVEQLPPTLRYEVRWRIFDMTATHEWSNPVSVQVPFQSHVVSGLVAGAVYEAQVRTVTEEDFSDWSPSGMVDLDEPITITPPTPIEFVPRFNGSVVYLDKDNGSFTYELDISDSVMATYSWRGYRDDLNLVYAPAYGEIFLSNEGNLFTDPTNESHFIRKGHVMYLFCSDGVSDSRPYFKGIVNDIIVDSLERIVEVKLVGYTWVSRENRKSIPLFRNENKYSTEEAARIAVFGTPEFGYRTPEIGLTGSRKLDLVVKPDDFTARTFKRWERIYAENTHLFDYLSMLGESEGGRIYEGRNGEIVLELEGYKNTRIEAKNLVDLFGEPILPGGVARRDEGLVDEVIGDLYEWRHGDEATIGVAVDERTEGSK